MTTENYRRCLLVSDRYTVLDDGSVRQTPADAFTDGLPALLEKVAQTFDGDGVLLLDARAAARLGLPTDPKELANDGKSSSHPALEESREVGWKVSELREWTTFRGDDRNTVRLGILHLMDPARSPLLSPWSPDTVSAHRIWHNLVGAPYHGTPGVAGITAIRALARVAKSSREPTWQPKFIGPDDALEPDYEVAHWRRRPDPEDTHIHGYDVTRMYLAAAGLVDLAPWGLSPTGKVRPSSDRAGWWLVALAPWNDEGKLPNPAGYGNERPDGLRWVTRPTLDLIDQLVEQGIHGGYEINDSYTGTGAGRVLRQWSERLNKAFLAVSIQPDPGQRDRAAVAAAVKSTYKEGWGMLNNPRALIRRPDWHYAIKAMARANLWRKMQMIALQSGRYPAEIDVDNVRYTASDEDAFAACPTGIKLADPRGVPQLGEFTHRDTGAIRRRRSVKS